MDIRYDHHSGDGDAEEVGAAVYDPVDLRKLPRGDADRVMQGGAYLELDHLLQNVVDAGSEWDEAESASDVVIHGDCVIRLLRPATSGAVAALANEFGECHWPGGMERGKNQRLYLGNTFKLLLQRHVWFLGRPDQFDGRLRLTGINRLF